MNEMLFLIEGKPILFGDQSTQRYKGGKLLDSKTHIGHKTSKDIFFFFWKREKICWYFVILQQTSLRFSSVQNLTYDVILLYKRLIYRLSSLPKKKNITIELAFHHF